MTMGPLMRITLLPATLLLLTTGCSGPADPAASNNPGATGGTASGGTGGGGTGGSSAAAGSSGAAAGGSGGVVSTGGAGGATGGTPSSGTGGVAAGNTGGGGAVAPTAMDCPTTQVARTPLRRLTRFEYAATVKDLLNVDPTPAADLPADEVTNAFDNNAVVQTVSSLHAEKYVLVSEVLAEAAVQNLATLTACDAVALGEDACALEFARSFGRRAFRRPLTAADETALLAAYAAGKTGGTHAEGIEVMIRAALQSSNFLYRLETTTPADPGAALVPLSQFELASRLSFLIWSTGPDEALLDAAQAGALATPAQVAAKAREMLASPKAHAAIAHFFDLWIGTSRLEITSKSAAAFPSFSNELKSAMMRETPAFVEHVLWTGDHMLSTLLTSPLAFVSGPLAAHYGVAAPAGSETVPQLVELPAAQGRAGLLTQAGFLSAQAHPDQTSPVLRGKFVRTMLLCDPPDPPPDTVNVTLPSVDQAATARIRFSAHSEDPMCAGCHTMMDPIGFTFEHFDATGAYRETENGQAIDVNGEVFEVTDPALIGPFVGVQALAQKLAASDQVRDCMATQWFRYGTGRTEVQPDSCSLGTLFDAFGATGGDVNELIVGITQTDAFMYRAPVTP